MAISNYGELKTAVAARAVRSDLTSLIPDFIRRAHDLIVRKAVIASEITADAATEALPSDFREVVSLAVQATPMIPVISSSEPQMANLGTGVPSYFRVSGSTLYLAPTPDESYSLRLLYRPTRTFFSADDDTNTILTRHPYAYFYGALSELFAHIRNTEEQAKYDTLFRDELEQLTAAEAKDAWTGDLQPRVGVVV